MIQLEQKKEEWVILIFNLEMWGTKKKKKAIVNVLGSERRDNLLATLYVLRSDVNLLVRQSSLHVWKTVVSNTPRTMREILPSLMRIIISCLGSSVYDKRQAGARTLGTLSYLFIYICGLNFFLKHFLFPKKKRWPCQKTWWESSSWNFTNIGRRIGFS